MSASAFLVSVTNLAGHLHVDCWEIDIKHLEGVVKEKVFFK